MGPYEPSLINSPVKVHIDPSVMQKFTHGKGINIPLPIGDTMQAGCSSSYFGVNALVKKNRIQQQHNANRIYILSL